MKFSTPTSVYILFIFFIPNSIALINVPGIPLMSVNRVYIVFWIIFFLLFLGKIKRIRVAALSYPFYKPMLIIILSMVLSTIFSQYFSASVNLMVSFFVESFLVSLMVWVAYRQPEDIIHVMRHLVLIFVGLSIYGTISYLIGFNPIIDFINTHFSSESRTLIFSYADVERLGLYGRAQSIFSHAMQYGAFLVMILCMSYYLYTNESGLRKFLNYPYIAILTIGLMFTNSRTPFVFLIVIVTLYWYFQNVTSKIRIVIAVLVFAMAAMPFTNDSTIQLISSIFTEISGGASDVGGSSFEMRLEQLSASFSIFREAPIVGHGLATTRVLLKNGILPADLQGAESFLFSLLIDAGAVGILAYAYFFSFILYYFFKVRKKIIASDLNNLPLLMVAFVFGYITFILMTGVLGTFQMFIVIITLYSRFIYLCLLPAHPLPQKKYTV